MRAPWAPTRSLGSRCLEPGAEEAWRNPFPGATPEACIIALEEIMRSIGDSCPDC